MNANSLKNERLLNVTLHDIRARNWSDDVRQEYDAAVADLLSKNRFHLCKNVFRDKAIGPEIERGPYNLHLRIADNKLVWDIRRMVMDEKTNESYEKKREQVTVPMSPFRSHIKDYFIICESYYNALKTSHNPSQIETVDMARRGVHNEAAELLMTLLMPQIDVDHDTARRLFTLICVLHLR